jgi:TolA-binding protein
MKNKIFLLIGFSFLASCNLMTRQEMQKQDEQKQIITNIQKTKADSESKISDLQNDIRTVDGKVDSIDHNVQVGQQNNKQEIEALKKTIDAQNEKIKYLQEHIDATETRLTAAINALKPGMASIPAATTDDGSGKKMKDASNPLDEAEALLSAKDYKKAIVKYQNYIDKNPKGKALAEATYKIGLCFAELGLKKEAKEFYKDVIDNYASTSWAKKAKYRVSHLK